MKYNQLNDEWIGTPTEIISKLLETHGCMCEKVRVVLEAIINGENEIKEKKNL